MKILKWLDEHFEECLLVVLLVLIACVELLQVVFRNLPSVRSLTWAEEFCRFCWIGSVFLSLPYTIRKGSMLRVSVLAERLPPAARSCVAILAELVNAAVMALLFFYALRVVGGVCASGETSTAMGWAMWAVYAVLPVGFGLAALRGVQAAVVRILRSRAPEEKRGGA